MKPIIYCTRSIDERFTTLFRPTYEIVMATIDQVDPMEDVVTYGERVEALWTTIDDQVDASVLDALPNVRVIANMGVGFNNIDVKEAQRRGIIVCHTPDVLTESTADLAFGLLMSAARQLPEAERSVRKGTWKAWEPFSYTGVDVYGASIGIIGMGRIGEAVARRAKGFDMDIYYYNRNRKEEAERTLEAKYVDVDTLIETCQFVVLFAPLTDETRHLIDANALKRMRKDAVLVNAARGGMVDEEALYEALQAGEIFAAGLDVFKEEPLPTDHPLLTLPNVVALPHIGSASIRTREKMLQMNARSIRAVLEGEEPNNVVPKQ